jgi:hypothetical protein
VTTNTQGGELLWHYTCGLRLAPILADGAIKPATAYVPVGAKPAVWFSRNPVWEETANQWFEDAAGRRVFGTKQATHERGGGLARVGVHPTTAPHDWVAYKQLSGVSPKMARFMYNQAVAAGSKPSEWFISFEPVPADRWRAVELWDGVRWFPHPEVTLAPV